MNYNIKDQILNDIAIRYAIYDRPKNGQRNIVVDSYFPKFFYDHIKHINLDHIINTTFPKGAVAISEFASEFMNVPLMDRTDLFRLVGYDIKTLTKFMREVARKQLTLVMLGYGGTGVNTLEWLYQISLLTNVPNLFKEIQIYEPDTLELSNLIRFPTATLMPIDTKSLTYRQYTSDYHNIYSQLENIYGYKVSYILEKITFSKNFAASEPFKNSQTIHTIEHLIEDVMDDIDNGEYDSTRDNISIIKRILENDSPYEITNGFNILTNDHKANLNIRTDNLSISKFHMLKPNYERLVKGNIYITENKFNPANSLNRIPSLYKYPEFSSYKSSYKQFKNTYHYSYQSDDIIFYGAPDIETRASMVAYGLPLITATHSTDEAGLCLNPIQDSSLQVESYGSIKLTGFFLNQIRMAVGLLEYLASDFDLTEQNKNILTYNYEQDASPLPTKVKWNLQLEHDGYIRSDL